MTIIIRCGRKNRQTRRPKKYLENETVYEMIEMTEIPNGLLPIFGGLSDYGQELVKADMGIHGLDD